MYPNSVAFRMALKASTNKRGVNKFVVLVLIARFPDMIPVCEGSPLVHLLTCIFTFTILLPTPTHRIGWILSEMPAAAPRGVAGEEVSLRTKIRRRHEGGRARVSVDQARAVQNSDPSSSPADSTPAADVAASVAGSAWTQDARTDPGSSSRAEAARG